MLAASEVAKYDRTLLVRRILVMARDCFLVEGTDKWNQRNYYLHDKLLFWWDLFHLSPTTVPKRRT
jgi:hypothetical protein